jgi:hypothetical protein
VLFAAVEFRNAAQGKDRSGKSDITLNCLPEVWSSDFPFGGGTHQHRRNALPEMQSGFQSKPQDA